MDVHLPRPLLAVAAEVLTADPSASLAEVAAAAWIGRTTLHKRYPKREDLVLAVGHDSVKRLAAAIEMANLPTSGTAEQATEALRTLVGVLIPQGAQINFLLRHPSIDDELTDSITALDAPVMEFVQHAKNVGVLNATLPSWWVVSTLYALVYSAWEAVNTGHLALLDSPRLAFDTLIQGVGG